LVWFRCKDDREAPWAGAFANPTVVEKSFNLLHDDGGFVFTIAGRRTANRTSVACVDAEFEVGDRSNNAFLDENVPIDLKGENDAMENKWVERR